MLSRHGSDRDDDVIVTDFKIDLLRSHIACLRPTVWLNDEVLQNKPILEVLRDLEYCWKFF